MPEPVSWDGPVTLDGAPATIVNRRSAFPSVVRIDNGTGCTFAPSVIDRIIDLRDGAFRS